LVVVVVLLIVFRKIFQPLLLGLGIAYLFDPAVSWFERHRRSRTFGVIVLVVLMLVLLTGFILYVVPATGEQFDRLEENLPEYSRRIRSQVEPWLDRLQARYPEEIDDIQQRVVESIRENFPRLAGGVGRVGLRLFDNVFDSLLFLLNLIFVPVFAFYLLIDFPKIKRTMTDLIPFSYRDTALTHLREVDQAIASFLRGQVTIALILATINSIGLVIIGVPFGFFIGIVAGLANMIPYMALVVGLTPALILCWAEYQSWARLIAVVAVFSGAQLLEGTVLSPRILGRSVNLHPVWVLLSIIAGGTLFGFIGMLIAVPVAAAVQVFANHWLEFYRGSAVYGAPREESTSEDSDAMAAAD
jgi:predicted PurR-regulated permease PerM